MALSKSVVITFLTKFDKKGLKRAEKELKGLDKTIAVTKANLSIWAKTAGVAAVYGLYRFAKSSITAALAQEKLDKSLQLTLKSIGKGGLAKETSFFIQQLQSATNVGEGELVPALQSLIAQTGNLEQSQYLLKTALDVSAGTGKDLTEVIDAISKAAVGNYKSIGTLGVGFTAAQAKAMGFVGTMKSLDKFTGAAEAQTQTFGGELKAFKISAGEATETLGKGFLDAYAVVAAGRPLIKDLGSDLEDVAGQFSDITVGFAAIFKEKGLGGYVDLLKIGFENLVGSYSTLQEIEKSGKRARYSEKETANQRENRLKDTKKDLTYQDILLEIQKNIAKNSKILTKEQQAQNQLAKQKAQIESIFDIEKINLQAALTRKLSVEDQARVQILLKLKEGTKEATDEAQKYLDVLTIIADGKISTEEIEMLAKKWKMTTPEVLLYLKALFDSNAELQKMLALLNQVSTTKLTTPMTTTTTTAIPLQTGQMAKVSQASQEVVSTVSALTDQQIQDKYGTAAQAEIYLAKQAIDKYGLGARYAGMLLGAVAMADGGIVNQPTLALMGESGAEAVIPLDQMSGFGTQLTVNVAGSVISEGQLATVIQDALYNLNRTGAVSQLANLGR
jgi:tellurite resistance protein